MPTYNITAPDGKKLRITVPEGTSPDEVLQHVQANYAETAKKTELHNKTLEDSAAWDAAHANPTSDSGLENFVAGVTRGQNSFVGGVRQKYNALVGDKEKLAELNQSAEQTNKQDAPLLDTTEGAAGDFTGKVLPTAALALLTSRFGPAIPMLAARGAIPAAVRGGIAMAQGALGGAAGGATSELTPEQEAAGMRAENTESGAKWGAALVPGIGALKYGARQVGNMFRDLPEEAMLNLAHRLGYTGNPADAIARLRAALSDARSSVGGRAREMYSAAEDTTGLPSVGLDSLQQNLDPAVVNATFTDLAPTLNPKVARVGAALRGGATSPIISATGDALPTTASFSDMRDAIRQLKSAKRALEATPEGSTKAQGYGRMITEMEASLDNWASRSPDSQAARDAGNAADQYYREQVLPFVAKKTPLGNMTTKTGDYVVGAEDKFLDPSAGNELQDMLIRAPGTLGPMRGVAGARILEKTGSTPAADALRNIPPALLTPEERALQGRIVEALRRRTGEGRSILPNIFQGTGALARWKNGVDPAESATTRYLQRTFYPLAGYTAGRDEENN